MLLNDASVHPLEKTAQASNLYNMKRKRDYCLHEMGENLMETSQIRWIYGNSRSHEIDLYIFCNMMDGWICARMFEKPSVNYVCQRNQSEWLTMRRASDQMIVIKY